MDKCTIPSPDELMLFWRKGWPCYVMRPIEDYPAILAIAMESAKISGEDIEDDKGQARVKLAITAIAMYCYHSDEFGKKNIRYIEKAFPRVIHEMQYAKRSSKLQAQIDAFNDYYDRDKRKAEENERLSHECTERSKKWIEDNWTAEDEADYQRWVSGGMKVPSCKLK
jgi:hypothetical protein